MSTPRLLPLALGFYATMAAAALLWGQFTDNPFILWQPGQTTWHLAAVGLLAGATLGLAVVGLSRLLMRYRWAKELARWMASALGPLSWPEAAALAGVSAVAEEMLFRGAIQTSWGLTIASVLFGLAHFPTQRHLWPWTISAGIMGLVFGLGTRLSGNLAFAVAAHFIINLLNLRHLSRLEVAQSHSPALTAQPEAAPPPQDHTSVSDAG